MSIEDLLASALSGNQRALARTATLLERGGAAASEASRQLAQRPGGSHVIGVTGPPGAGKSSLLASLTRSISAANKSIAVLAVDPTSPVSGGATLGDRIRMSETSLLPGVFVRSVAARSHVDGLAAAVPDLIRLFSAAGYDYVVVETVGSGQNQFTIADYVHTLILVEAPGAGDSVQMLKAGIMELADLYVVTKGDLPGAHRVSRELRAMLSLSDRSQRWSPVVVVTSSETGEGIEKLIAEVDRHLSWLRETGTFAQKEQAMALGAIRSSLILAIETYLAGPAFAEVAVAVRDHRLSPEDAASIILQQIGKGYAPD